MYIKQVYLINVVFYAVQRSVYGFVAVFKHKSFNSHQFTFNAKRLKFST